ncbi:MAG: VPLPA-CTERM sorting domain-containing protein [Deltaproteobacteria bacterium]|nr:VPLPA-CTERM sorting domain-containing protein [Deltaproteobacteria bacterium]
MWLRLDLGSGSVGVYDTGGDVTLLGLEENSGLYNAVNIVWNEIQSPEYGNLSLNISVGVANDDDNIGAVPIPGAIWLLGSGLLGMVGMRRRKKV